MKFLFHAALLVVTLFFWKGFVESGREIEGIKERLEVVENTGDPKDEAQKIEEELQAAEGGRLMMGLLLTIGSCLVGGIFVWVYFLPFMAQRATHAIYDSGEMIEKSAYHDAHSLVAQGDYEAAIGAFHKVALEDPGNRMPWVEMAKIQRQNLEDPDAAIAVLREALEAQEWQEDDAAFLLFRLAEIYVEDREDWASGRMILQQVIDTFPATRHSANATHKLNEWQRAEEEKAMMDRLHGKGSEGNPPA